MAGGSTSSLLCETIRKSRGNARRYIDVLIDFVLNLINRNLKVGTIMDESLYIRSNNVELYTTIKGRFASKDILIILHGGPGSGAGCLLDLEAFKSLEEKYILVYYDQRGSGKSTYDVINGLEKEAIVEDLNVVVTYVKNRFKEKNVYLWGGSFGGYLGFLYLNKYKNSVKKYIASSPGMGFKTALNEESILAFVKIHKKKVPQELVNIAISNLGKCKFKQEIFNDKKMKDIIFSKENTLKSLKHIYAMKKWIFDTEIIDKLQSYTDIPILILQGDKDNICRYELINEALNKAQNRNITFIAYSNCGHNLFEDAKDKFVKDIVEFIEKEGLTLQ